MSKNDIKQRLTSWKTTIPGIILLGLGIALVWTGKATITEVAGAVVTIAGVFGIGMKSKTLKP